jgi:hypothetical protein
MTYARTQRSNWIWSILVLVLLVDIVVFSLIDIDRTILAIAILPGFMIIAVVAWLFSSMTVEVTPSELRWQFGPGIWKKSIARADIAHVAADRAKWWYGWGVRRTPRGWLYSVSGLDIVAVTTHDGKTTLIGTSEPRALTAALAI